MSYDFFAKLSEEMRAEREKYLTWIEKNGLYGTRKQPFMPIETLREEAGTLIRKGSKKTREKILRQARTITRCKVMMTGKYIPAGGHQKLGRANVDGGGNE